MTDYSSPLRPEALFSLLSESELLYAFLLACGSSVDNFTVGITLGIKSKTARNANSPPVQFNLLISLANSIGAYLAGSIGYFTVELISSNNSSAAEFASLLAGLAFYYLAINEFMSTNDDDKSKNSSGRIPMKEAMELAIPMTLNNIAGGITGGVVGVSPLTSFIFAFLCSYGMMDVGYRVARSFGFRWVGEQTNTIAFVIFGLLGNYQILDYLGVK